MFRLMHKIYFSKYSTGWAENRIEFWACIHYEQDIVESYYFATVVLKHVPTHVYFLYKSYY